MKQSTQRHGYWVIIGLMFCLLVNTGAKASPAVIQSSNDPETLWIMALPEEDIVAYKGLASFDQAGGHEGTMLYPAPSLAGFAAAVVTHAVLESSVRKHEKSKIQTEADKVLAQYEPILSSFHYKELFQDGVARMAVRGKKTIADPGSKPAKGWLVETDPVFSMTQDQSAIVLDNIIRIYNTENPSKKAVYQNTVRVISGGAITDNPANMWLANQGARIKHESADLLAASLDIAIKDASGSLDTHAEEKTLHYVLGRDSRVERGQAVASVCNRLLIRNLRGWLMSVPTKPDVDMQGARPKLPEADETTSEAGVTECGLANGEGGTEVASTAGSAPPAVAPLTGPAATTVAAPVAPTPTAAHATAVANVTTPKPVPVTEQEPIAASPSLPHPEQPVPAVREPVSVASTAPQESAASAAIEPIAQSVATQLSCGVVQANGATTFIAPCGTYSVLIDCDSGQCRPMHTINVKHDE